MMWLNTSHVLGGNVLQILQILSKFMNYATGDKKFRYTNLLDPLFFSKSIIINTKAVLNCNTLAIT